MPLLRRKRLLAAKVEATPGTAETLANADAAFNVYNPVPQANIEVETREAQAGFGMLSGVPGSRAGSLTFRTEIWWDGTVTMPSWAAILLPACGWVDSSQTFNPTSEAPGSNVKTLTMGVYEDGLRKQLVGAAGTFQIVCPTGDMVYCDWTFTGVWQPVTDTALLSPTYPNDKPLRYATATTQFNSNNLCVEQITFDAGNTVTLRECAASAAGFDYAVITNRAPTITANPESQLVATRDDYGDWLASTEAEFSVTLDGISTSTIEISAPKAQITNVQEGDREGIQIDDITYSCNKNGATDDQELQIIFTESS